MLSTQNIDKTIGPRKNQGQKIFYSECNDTEFYYNQGDQFGEAEAKRERPDDDITRNGTRQLI